MKELYKDDDLYPTRKLAEAAVKRYKEQLACRKYNIYRIFDYRVSDVDAPTKGEQRLGKHKEGAKKMYKGYFVSQEISDTELYLRNREDVWHDR